MHNKISTTTGIIAGSICFTSLILVGSNIHTRMDSHDLQKLFDVRDYYMQHDTLPAWLWPHNLKPITSTSSNQWIDQHGTEHSSQVPTINNYVEYKVQPGSNVRLPYKTPMGKLVDAIDDGTPYSDVEDKFTQAIQTEQNTISHDATNNHWIETTLAVLAVGFLLACVGEKWNYGNVWFVMFGWMC